MKLHLNLLSSLLVGFLGAASSADVSSATVSNNVAWTGDPLALIDHDTTTTAVTYPVDTCDVETKDVGYVVIDMGFFDQLVSGVVLYLEPGNHCNLFLAGWEDGEEEPMDPPSEPIATLKFEPAPTGRPSLAPSIVPTMAPSMAPSSPPSKAPSMVPSAVPSLVPSAAPSLVPSLDPSDAPSLAPVPITPAPIPATPAPSAAPSSAPSEAPSAAPSSAPSKAPSGAPVAPTPAPVAAPAPVATTTGISVEATMVVPQGLLCILCSGPPQICEKVYHSERCPGNKPFCMNYLQNWDTGARSITRTCEAYRTCFQEWHLGSSDFDACQDFDQTDVLYKEYQCKFCCAYDNCNEPIKAGIGSDHAGPGFSQDPDKKDLDEYHKRQIKEHFDNVRASLQKAGIATRRLTEEGSNVHSTGSAHSLVHVPSTGLTVDFKEPKAYRFLKIWVGKHETSSDVKIFEIKPLYSKAKAASKTKTANSNGDPHFKTFSGEKFDFHGGCDLVLLQVPSFAHGLGLTIQIRTKIETWWSFIEAAVVKIGDQTIEIMGSEPGEDTPKYWINRLAGDKEVDKDVHLKNLVDVLASETKGFNVHHKQVSSNRHRFRIALDGAAISIETFKSWVSVNVKAVKAANFENATGLMGAYPSGVKLARNGTAIDDPIEFGKEWQVLRSEPMLFHTIEGSIQHPHECPMPNTDMKTGRHLRRRLGQSMISEEDAELACAHADEENRGDCIYDVLATNDKDQAGAY